MHSLRNSIIAVTSLLAVLALIGLIAGTWALAYVVGILILLSLFVSVVGVFVLAVMDARRRPQTLDACLRCGHPLHANASRCPHCGSRIVGHASIDEMARRLEKLKSGYGSEMVLAMSERPQQPVQVSAGSHIQVARRRARSRQRPSWWSKKSRR